MIKRALLFAAAYAFTCLIYWSTVPAASLFELMVVAYLGAIAALLILWEE